MNIVDVREYFMMMYDSAWFTTDRTGAKTIELLGASFTANEPQIFGKVNTEYVNREISWYQSQSTNIKDIYKGEREEPKAWQYAANIHGEINSNYGYLIYSPKFYKQYEQAVKELFRNEDTRRATMIYTRPSIWIDYNENQKNDFICTNAVTYYLRDNEVHAVVQMRSNDAIFGYKNDYAWQLFVLGQVASDVGCNVGNIYWQCQNLHIYERHFYLIDHYSRTGEKHITKAEYDELYK